MNDHLLSEHGHHVLGGDRALQFLAVEKFLLDLLPRPLLLINSRINSRIMDVPVLMGANVANEVLIAE